MKSKKALAVITALVLTFGLCAAGCGSQQATLSEGSAKKTVAVTIVPEETFAKAVCGDLMNVVVLVPPGNSPENYELTPEQMEKFSQASLYFTVGVPTEEANIVPQANEIEGLTIVNLADEVAAVYPERTFNSGERDPHIWLSPKRAKVMVETMAKEMAALDKENAAQYNKNAQAYVEKLDALDTEIKDILQGVEDKKFIVFHPAFGYLADDYGLTMYALEQEGKEATPEHLAEMIDLAKEENIKAIFYQDEIDSKQSEAFAEEIGGQTIQLSPLSADYINNLKKMAQLIQEAAK